MRVEAVGRYGLSAKGSYNCILLAEGTCFLLSRLCLSQPFTCCFPVGFMILSIFQCDPVLTFYTPKYDTFRKNWRSYTEMAWRIECWEQGFRIKAVLRRKVSEDLGRAIEVFMDRMSAKYIKWWLFKSLEWKKKKDVLKVSENPWIKCWSWVQAEEAQGESGTFCARKQENTQKWMET